jgi:hypothetical protein
MALSKIQKNEILEAIQAAQLDPNEFEWLPGAPAFPNRTGQETLNLPGYGFFQFAFDDGFWWQYCEPGDGTPYTGPYQVGPWPAELSAVGVWLRTISAEASTPDLWQELQRERELLTQATSTEDGPNTPFSSEELTLISRQIAELKQYITESNELDAAQRRLLEARLDHVERAAPHTGRIDWWNQLTGALLNLVLTNVIPAGAVQGLLVLAAHGLTGLFGGGPPELVA